MDTCRAHLPCVERLTDHHRAPKTEHQGRDAIYSSIGDIEIAAGRSPGPLLNSTWNNNRGCAYPNTTELSNENLNISVEHSANDQ